MQMIDEKRRLSPAWEARREGRIADPVPRDTPGAREIGFAIAERYNASSILFDNLAAGRGQRPALYCEGRATTYAELCETAARAGAGLVDFGLRRGQRVLLLLDDTPAYAAAIFGALRAGLAPVLVNTLSPADLIAYFLQDSGAEVAIVQGGLLRLLAHEGVRASRLRHVVTVGAAPEPPPPHLHSVHAWDEWLAAQSAALPAADTHADEMAFWMYSSGSTGRPKGVVHLHHDAPYTYESYGRRVLGIREADIVFSPPKIFFAYGFGNAITFPFSVGATTVLHPGRPDPDAVYGVIERPADDPFGLPTLYGARRRTWKSDCHPCACASPPPRCYRASCSGNGNGYGLSIVEGLSTEVRTCTCRTGRRRSPVRAGGRCRATRSSSPTPTAIRSSAAHPA
jgi:acetyl-CoA synthetase